MIVEKGGLTEGAEALGKSQPSVSRTMALLEDRIGAPAVRARQAPAAADRTGREPGPPGRPHPCAERRGQPAGAKLPQGPHRAAAHRGDADLHGWRGVDLHRRFPDPPPRGADRPVLRLFRPAGRQPARRHAGHGDRAAASGQRAGRHALCAAFAGAQRDRRPRRPPADAAQHDHAGRYRALSLDRPAARQPAVPRPAAGAEIHRARRSSASAFRAGRWPRSSRCCRGRMR
jgi:hypothetical protein